MRKKAQKRGRANPRGDTSPAQRSGPGYTWVLPAVAAFAIFVSLSTVLFGIIVNDEGVTTMSAWRVTQGQIPYRDFFSIITPFSFYYLALAFKVGGVCILTERIAGALLGVLLVLLTARLSKAYISLPLFAALPAAALCASGVSLWPFPSHHWLAGVLVLGALLCAERALAHRPFLWSAAAGSLASLAFWSLQDQGAYLWIGAALLLLPWLGKEKSLRSAAGWLAGGVLASLPFLLLTLKVPASTLWYDLVGFNLTAYREANDSAFVSSFKEFYGLWTSGGWSQAPLYMGNVIFSSVLTILMPMLCVPLAIWGWWRRWDSGPRCAVLAVGGLSFVGTILHRWAPVNLQWGQALPAVTAAWALSVWYARGGQRGRRISTGIALIMMASFLAYGAQRAWAALNVERTIKVTASAGTLYANDPYQASYVQETLDQIEHRLKPGAPLLTLGLPFFNFWTLRPNAVPYDWFMPPVYSTPQQTQEVIRALDQRRQEWILTTRKFEATDQPFTQYLKSRYSRTWENPACGLWHRNADEPGGR